MITSSTYDIDPSTNSIDPGSTSRWYMFAIPLFANERIPYNVLTTTNQCLVKVELDANKFILPTSPNQIRKNLNLYDCKLVASQVILPPNHYATIVKNKLIRIITIHSKVLNLH